MPQPDIESDQFLTLLSEALRSGPGSPSWHDAIRALRTAGQGGADEYALLVRAREALESGKDYRSVHAGPAFTSNLMRELDDQSSSPTAPGILSANLIAFLAAAVILAVIVVVAVVLMRGSESKRAPGQELAGTYFGANLIPATHFDSALPVAWRPFGPLGLICNHGLRPATLPADPDTAFRWGGIVTADPIPAVQPIEVTLQLRLNHPSDSAVTQLFVTDRPVDASAAGPHELVWEYKAGEAAVFLSGRADQQTLHPSKSSVAVRLLLGRETAIIECDGRRMYDGPHQLDHDQPRYVGIRFLRPPGDQTAEPVVESIGIQMP